MADQLTDLGKPVRCRTLVLNTLRGLNDRFAYMATLIQRHRPFPTLIEVRSDLRLTEITMQAKHAAPAQALTASAPRPPAPPSSNSPAGSGGKKQTRHGGKRNGGGSSPQAAAAPGVPTPATPWAGTTVRPGPLPPGWQPAYGTLQAFWAGPPDGRPPRPQALYVGQHLLPGPQSSQQLLPGPQPSLAPHGPLAYAGPMLPLAPVADASICANSKSRWIAPTVESATIL